MKMKPLTEFCALNMGQSPSSETYNDENVGLPFFQGNADFGEVHPKVRIWCSSPVKVAAAGDILISVRAPIGAMNIANTPCCIGRGLAALSPNPGTCVQEYLYYALQSRIDSLIAQGTGSTFKAIGKKTLEDTQIPAYSLDEQQIISDTLSETDQLITKTKAQVSLLDQLVKSRFVEMFGDITANDRGWITRPLGELCTIVRGGSPRPIEQYLGGNIPWIKIGDATEGESIYLRSTKEHIIPEGVKKSRMVKAGSLIFANCGVSLGFARIITFDGCIHDGWLALEDVDVSIDKVFLLQTLNQMTAHFREIAPSGTQPNLNTSIMKAHMQIIPPMVLQRRFIDFVSEVDKSKFRIQKSLSTSRKLWTMAQIDAIMNMDFSTQRSL